jgi:hypothetical protein
MRKLILLSAYYRNDIPQGLGVTLTDLEGDLDDAFSVLKESYDAMWKEAVRDSNSGQLVVDLYEQLNDLIQIRHRRPLRLKEALLAIGNIYLLEKICELKPDEFNGLMYGYAE